MTADLPKGPATFAGVDPAMSWEAFADAIPDLVVRADRSGTILYASQAARTLGYEPDELVGRNTADFIHPEDLATFQANTAAVFTGTPLARTVRREHRFRRKDGAWAWLRGNPSILPAGEGRPVEVLNIFRDVTREVTTAQASRRRLQAALDEAEQAAAVKAEFLANMSHEIRTPLTAVIGFAGLLAERTDLDETAGRYVARIGGAGRALLAIVNDILDFTKLEAGQMSFQPRPASAIAAAREVLEVFALEAADKAIALHFEAAPEVPDHVSIDADRLRQILLSLVGNAVKFTARGAVTARLAYDPKTWLLSVDVADTGPGIAASQRKKLFQQFSQIDGSSTRTKGGTGLGLAIAHGLAAAMGGRLTVTSRVGRGSTFRLELPAQPAEVAPAAAAGDVALEVFLGLRVLVVDDNANNRELARAILEQFGVEVSEAANGAEALRLAQRAPLDVILMDMRMPGMDGRAALAAIRATPGPNQDMPILAFSADNIGDAPDMADLSEFQGRVIKPIVPSAMLAAIAGAVGDDPAFAMEGEDAAAA
ncbi:MAG: sensor histidine kinase/response regulator [Phenylobacterium sp.]|nr:sensor histidine kinase/response regulator [Phenylobacterium sp.]